MKITHLYVSVREFQQQPCWYLTMGDFDEKLNQVIRELPNRIGYKDEKNNQYYWIVPISTDLAFARSVELLFLAQKAELSRIALLQWVRVITPVLHGAVSPNEQRGLWWDHKNSQWLLRGTPRDIFEDQLFCFCGALPLANLRRANYAFSKGVIYQQKPNWQLLSSVDDWFKDLAVAGITASIVAIRQKERMKREAYARLTNSYAIKSPRQYAVPTTQPALCSYQNAGIDFMVNNDRVLLGDDQGLGKTAQVLGLINFDIQLSSILIICPATVRGVWDDEWKKWSTRNDLNVHIITGRKDHDCFLNEQNNVFIINYDNLFAYAQDIRLRKWDLIVADESHYLKNAQASRTIALFGGISKSKQLITYAPLASRKVVLMSGTPLGRGVIDIYPLISYLDPNLFPDYLKFGKRYCQAHMKHGHWSFNGSANLEELQCILREKLMIRRQKAEVLHELPAKIRQIVTLEHEAAYKEEQKALYQLVTEWEQQAKNESGTERSKNFTPSNIRSIAAIRQKTALAKIPFITNYVRDLLEETSDDHKIILFATHHRILDALAQMCTEQQWEYAHFDGRTPRNERKKAVSTFQDEKQCRIIILGIIPGGTGITLTSADHEIFVEQEWVPHVLSQAEDRAYRMGQKRNVHVAHLVIKGSIDAYMIKKTIQRQNISDQALNKNTLNQDYVDYDYEAQNKITDNADDTLNTNSVSSDSASPDSASPDSASPDSSNIAEDLQDWLNEQHGKEWNKSKKTNIKKSKTEDQESEPLKRDFGMKP